MSGTRFVRSTRFRALIVLLTLLMIFSMIVVFHSAQQQLEDAREQGVRCEQQQESLNERLQSIVEQKFNLEKTHERERNEQMETRRNLEDKLKDVGQAHTKEQLTSHTRYDKLVQTHKLLQAEHSELVGSCAATKKQQLDDANALERKVQSIRAELQKEKHVQSGEIILWQEKYNSLVREKERLELLLNAADAKGSQQQRIVELEQTVNEYQTHCDYKPANKKIESPQHPQQQQQQINKPLNPPDTTRNASPNSQQGFDKPRHHVDFNKQIAPKPIKKLSEETETQLKQQPDDSAPAAAAAALVADAAVVKMASPLSAPRKPTSTEATKSEHQQQQQVLEANAHLKQAINSTATSSSSSSLPPLALPPPKLLKQLPANVAPIPANFEQLLQQNDPKTADAEADKLSDMGMGGAGDAADIDAAVEEMQKNENDNDGNGNNRYANVVNDLESGQKLAAAVHKAVANEDSGAHEIKDHDFMNDQNFNLPAADEDNNNFFDGGAGGKHNGGAGDAAGGGVGGGAAEKHKDEDNEEDDVMGAGVDIAVKNPNHLLDAENLNNEVAGDQGKELFPDGLRLEDGNDEDEDEDDYSNPAARPPGAQAIRN